MIARRGVIKYLKYYRHLGDKRPDIIITRYTVRNLIVVACLGWLVSSPLPKTARLLFAFLPVSEQLEVVSFQSREF